MKGISRLSVRVGGGGVSTIFGRFFMSHSTEKFRRGTLVFQKFSGIEKSLNKRYHDFAQLFCLTVPVFCGEPFNDS